MSEANGKQDASLPDQNSIQYGSQPRRRTVAAALVRPIMGAVVATILLIVAWHVANEPRGVSSVPGAGQIVIPNSKPIDKVEFYRHDIVPFFDDYDRRNAAAINTALGVLKDRFDAHRRGIKPFCDDLTSWGTRFGVMGRLVSDKYQEWWNKKQNVDTVREYVGEKFRAHILSESALQDDVAATMRRLREELDASRNRLYAELRLPLAQIQSPILTNDIAVAKFNTQVQKALDDMTPKMGQDSVVNGIASFVGGWTIPVVTQGLTQEFVAQILTRASILMAAEGIDAGGATVGGTATGAGAGSTVGPAGIIVGVGVGLAVGWVIDWWMSKQFESHVTKQCNGFLDNVWTKLVKGDKNHPGLEASMRQAVRLTSQAQRKVILQSIEKATP